MCSAEATPVDALASHRQAQVDALLALSDAPTGIEDLATALAAVATSLTGVDGACVKVLDGPDLRSIAWSGLLDRNRGDVVPRGGSLSGIVLATAQPQLSRRVDTDPRVDIAACRRSGVSSMAILPVRHGHHTRAVLVLVSAEPDGLDETTIALVEPLTRLVAIRMGKSDSAIQAAQQLDVMRAVTATSKELLLSDDPGQTLVDSLRRLIDSTHIYLFRPDKEGRLSVSRGSDDLLDDIIVKPGQSSLAGSVYDSGQVRIVADWTGASAHSELVLTRLTERGATATRSGVYVPLSTPEGVVGVVVALLEESLKTADLELVGLLELLATEAGIAITREALRRQLADEARTDPLTGVSNRRTWDERLALETARSSRTDASLWVLMIDLDHFKAFNDEFGHPEGDRLLSEASKRWSALIRPTDLLARLGGEEFGLLLTDTDGTTAVEIAARLGAVVPSRQTVSIGAAALAQGESGEELLARADQALYDAKRAGRNRISTAAPPPVNSFLVGKGVPHQATFLDR